MSSRSILARNTIRSFLQDHFYNVNMLCALMNASGDTMFSLYKFAFAKLETNLVVDSELVGGLGGLLMVGECMGLGCLTCPFRVFRLYANADRAQTPHVPLAAYE